MDGRSSPSATAAGRARAPTADRRAAMIAARRALLARAVRRSRRWPERRAVGPWSCWCRSVADLGMPEPQATQQGDPLRPRPQLGKQRQRIADVLADLHLLDRRRVGATALAVVATKRQRVPPVRLPASPSTRRCRLVATSVTTSGSCNPSASSVHRDDTGDLPCTDGYDTRLTRLRAWSGDNRVEVRALFGASREGPASRGFCRFRTSGPGARSRRPS
jgi:hypothetical protein